MLQPEPFDASDADAIAKRKTKKGREADEDKRVIEALMEHAEGRGFIWRILSACHIFVPSFDANNPHVTAYREGERNVGLRLLALVSAHAPKQYAQMTEEQANG